MAERKVATEEFKREAVRLAKERGNSAQTARDLGRSDNTLQGCKSQRAKTPENPFPGNGHARDAEMAQMKRDLARLKEENEILKAAVGLFTKAPRCDTKRFVVTTDSGHGRRAAENLLDRQFGSDAPDTRWSGDSAYVWTGAGWLSLAVILDLFSRRIVGWALGTTLERALVLSALAMAVQDWQPQAGLLCHSDRGRQYASGDYPQALKAAGILCRMSRKGNCWDTAPTERFFASRKRELAHRVRFATRTETKTARFDWIEVWRNRKRRHSTRGYVSPEAFERQRQKQQQRPRAA